MSVGPCKAKVANLRAMRGCCIILVKWDWDTRGAMAIRPLNMCQHIRVLEIRAWRRVWTGRLKKADTATSPNPLNVNELRAALDWQSTSGHWLWVYHRIPLAATGGKKKGAPLYMNGAQVEVFHKNKKAPHLTTGSKSRKASSPISSHHACTWLWNWSQVFQLNDTSRGQLQPYAYPQRTSYQVIKCILYMLHITLSEANIWIYLEHKKPDSFGT